MSADRADYCTVFFFLGWGMEMPHLLQWRFSGSWSLMIEGFFFFPRHVCTYMVVGHVTHGVGKIHWFGSGWVRWCMSLGVVELCGLEFCQTTAQSICLGAQVRSGRYSMKEELL